MTVEHRVIFGLEEIKAVIFQCNQCKTRVAIIPDELESIPHKCPKEHAWDWNIAPEFSGSCFLGLITSLRKLKDPIYEKTGFKILLEFEDAD